MQRPVRCCGDASCSCIERACLTFCDIQARARPLPNLLQLLKRKNPAALDETGLHAMRQLAAAASSSKGGAEAGEERQARLVAASRLIQSHGGCCAVLGVGWLPIIDLCSVAFAWADSGRGGTAGAWAVTQRLFQPVQWLFCFISRKLLCRSMPRASEHCCPVVPSLQTCAAVRWSSTGAGLS